MLIMKEHISIKLSPGDLFAKDIVGFTRTEWREQSSWMNFAPFQVSAHSAGAINPRIISLLVVTIQTIFLKVRESLVRRTFTCWSYLCAIRNFPFRKIAKLFAHRNCWYFSGSLGWSSPTMFTPSAIKRRVYLVRRAITWLSYSTWRNCVRTSGANQFNPCFFDC